MLTYLTVCIFFILAAIFGTFISYLLGFQIRLHDLRLLSCKYHYRIGGAQIVTFVSVLFAFLVSAFDISQFPSAWQLWFSLVALAIAFVAEWIISKLALRSAFATWMLRFCYVAILTVLMYETGQMMPLPYILMGLFVRNSPFGVPHGKNMCLAFDFHRFFEYKFPKVEDETLEECSYAGKKEYEIDSLPLYNVNDYGILPNTSADLSKPVQELLGKVGTNGGGRIFFPKGRYLFNKDGKGFIRINFSNICLEGELAEDGHLLAELVNCSSTSCGRKNPWLSPFFITTAESLQPSNEFFGLQFRKKKEVVNQSSSISDPGSDGSLLSPEFATSIIAPSTKGESQLHVADSTKVGKYIMLGLYNTATDGNLLKDILGVDGFRNEWTTAYRAGEEEAPSYQWLVEVKKVVDEHTIELIRPLLRDVEMIYEPRVYNVDLLENIVIRNLCINSKWNGCFRHHGFPVYYNVAQSQEMDYGWNAINLKRVAHSEVRNVEIRNFTNPLYVLDSRNITAENITICGYDGHQGIKFYQHACDNLFRKINFRNYFADMMGGEGNAYGNVFMDIYYTNPVFNPVDFDFHGFSEGPMSPPANNLFVNIYGFRYIKSAAAKHMLPGCARENKWVNIHTEGEKKDDILFLDLTYKPKRGLLRLVTAVGYSIVMMQKSHNLSMGNFTKIFRQKLKDIDATGIKPDEHYKLFRGSVIKNIETWSDLSKIDRDFISIQ